MSYRSISNVGSCSVNEPSNNPLTYCLTTSLNNSFAHGAIANSHSSNTSRNCQAFMADYCAKNDNEWNENGVCDIMSRNINKHYVDLVHSHSSPINSHYIDNLTYGEKLIRNAASRKYISEMNNVCEINKTPFDPTSASTPLVTLWSDNCVPLYEVDPNEIDNDPVMNRILQKPIIEIDILVNIYKNSVKKGILYKLKDTKLYKFFMLKNFQDYVNN